MTSQAKMATGSFVLYNGTVYAELTEITPPSYSVEKVDATSHDSTHKVSIPGQSAFGDLTFKANFINDTTQQNIHTLATAKTVGLWRFVAPIGSGLPTYSIPGFISSYSITTPLKGAPAGMSVSITPTETVTQVTAASTALLETPFIAMTSTSSPPVLVSPALSGTTYVYDYSAPQVLTDHYHIAATATTGTPTIYVDGEATASGAPNATPITMTLAAYPTGSVKTSFVVLDVVNTIPKIYRFRITRSSA